MCDEGGELIMCDKKGCPKSYHLSCVNRDSIPRGRWNCPYHHCDECGKASNQFCSQCPTSFCPAHHKNMAKTSDGLLLCDEHSGQVEKSDENLEDNNNEVKALEKTREKSPTNGINGTGQDEQDLAMNGKDDEDKNEHEKQEDDEEKEKQEEEEKVEEKVKVDENEKVATNKNLEMGEEKEEKNIISNETTTNGEIPS